MSETVVTVVIADDNPLVRIGLRSLLDMSPHVEVVGEARDGSEAVELIAQLRPVVALLDVRMPVMDGIHAAGLVGSLTSVLMLTSSEEPDVIQAALRNGASGYLVHGAHEPEEIVAAIQAAARGSMVLGPAAAVATAAVLTGAAEASRPGASAARFGMTAREAEIMAKVAEGMSNREIADACFLAEKTVKNHINRIFAKLGVRTRAEAVSRWLRPDQPTDRQEEQAL